MASPLELLFDLTFAAAFGVAGGQLAHGIAEGFAFSTALGFGFAMVAIVLAWINYSWFASAFDTDDWLFRVMTIVQMSGVVVLSIGLPQMFASFEHGEPVANEVMVAGYVIMRVALVAQWMRAAKANPQYHTLALTLVLFIGGAQLGWALTIVLPLDQLGFLLFALALTGLDWGGPFIAERRGASHGTTSPWHAHHIAERYSLLALIALGELVLGTLTAAQDVTDAEGWSVDSIAVIGLGVIMAFALWWVYFMLPSGTILTVQRHKAFVWGYGHTIIFATIAAIGAGLHLIGYVYNEHYDVTIFTVITTIAVPLWLFMVALYLLHSWLVSDFRKNTSLQITALALPVAAVVLAAIGWPLWACLALVVLSPLSIIVFYELGGWRHLEDQVTKASSTAPRVP